MMCLLPVFAFQENMQQLRSRMLCI